MSSFDISGFAPRTDQWWKPQVGDVIVGTVEYVGQRIKDDFDGKGGKELEIRIDLRQDDGEIVSVGVCARSSVDPITGDPLPDSYTKRNAAAVFDAVRRAGRTTIEPGSRLAIQRLADVPNKKGSGNPAQEFIADYAPPAPGAVQIPRMEPEAPATPQLPPGGLLGRPVANTAPQPAPAPQAPTVSAGGLLGATSTPGPFDTPAPQAQPAPGVDWAQLSQLTGMPETFLQMLSPEQLAALVAQPPAQSPAAPAPDPNAAASALSGLVARQS